MNTPQKLSKEATTAVGMYEAESGAGIVIQWQDGADLEYDFRGLRLACPCAMCIDENTGEKLLMPAMVPADITALSIESVGNYALKFTWSDGHSTGIYPFELLRHIGEARLAAVLKFQASKQSSN